MKNFINPLALLCLISGIMFKIQHWPGANALIVLSALGMLISLFIVFLEGNGEMPKRIHFLLLITLMVFIVGGIFRFMHWLGADIIGSIGYFLAVVMTVVLSINKDSFTISKRYFTVFTFFVLFLLASFPKNPLALITGSDYTTSEKMHQQMNPVDSTHQAPADH